MKKYRSSTFSSKLVRPIRLFTHLILVGIGFGVLAGSALKTISSEEKGKSQVIIKKWMPLTAIFKKVGSSSKAKNIRDNANDFTNLKLLVSNKEITSLSNNWKRLANQKKDLIASAFLFRLDDEKYAQLDSTDALPAASAIKIPILLVTLKLVDSKKLAWNEELQLKKELIGSGAGWMAYQPLKKQFPVHEVATEMIRVSDNTATNLLIERIGGIEVLNNHFKALGLHSTRVRNLMPDLAGTNTTSTQDLVRTITLVDQGNVLSQRTRDLFREVMSTSITNRLLPGGFLRGLGIEEQNIDENLQIKGYRIYNKTGDIGIAYADAGLIQMPDNTRAVAAFIVKGPFNDPRSAELIRQMAKALVPFLKPKIIFTQPEG